MLDKFKKGVKKIMDNVIEKVEVTKEVMKVVSSNDVMARKLGVFIIFIGVGIVAYSYVK